MYFDDEVEQRPEFRLHSTEFSPCPGISIIETPGHTAGHVSVFVELDQGSPILLAGDAADLAENIDDEIAPGLCYRDDPLPAIESIRKLKTMAKSAGAVLWPNHDLEFYRRLKPFPEPYA